MGDDVVLGLHLADRHSPLFGGCLNQHQPCRGTGVAQMRQEVPKRARAVGVLVAEAGLVTPGLGDLDLRPVGVELVGDHHGHRGAHALAHLRTVAGHRDGTVGRDAHEHLRVVLPAMRHGVGAELFGALGLLLRLGRLAPREGEHERSHAAEHGAPADIGERRGASGGEGGRVGHRFCVVNHRRSPFEPGILAAGFVVPALPAA